MAFKSLALKETTSSTFRNLFTIFVTQIYTVPESNHSPIEISCHELPGVRFYAFMPADDNMTDMRNL